MGDECRGRCWFSKYGAPGLRTDRCVRCGRPNPYDDPEEIGYVVDEENPAFPEVHGRG